MTNENAIRWLKDLLKSDLPMEQYETAIEKGIEALEPSGDLISREETLTAFADYVGSGMSMNDYDALWNIVTKMPSVKQEPKWIPVSERLPEDSGEYLVTVIIEDVETYRYTGIAWYAHPKDYDIEEGDWRELMIDEKVIAWMPLPTPYDPQERSGEE